jgi:hypothetical protein
VNVFKNVSHLQLCGKARPTWKVVGGQEGFIVDAFDLKVSSVLLAEFIAQWLSND